METFSALLALCSGNSPITGDFPSNSLHKGQRRGALVFFMICAWINCWVNNPESGDFRRHGAHDDAIVISIVSPCFHNCKLYAIITCNIKLYRLISRICDSGMAFGSLLCGMSIYEAKTPIFSYGLRVSYKPWLCVVKVTVFYGSNFVLVICIKQWILALWLLSSSPRYR